MTLLDMQARLMHLIYDQQGPDTNGTGTVPTSGDFNATNTARDLNCSLDVFVALTGFTPGVTEKLFTATIVAGLDYALPSDLVSLSRVEYLQVSGGVSFPQTLIPKSMADWDALTGSGYATSSTGAPDYFREPYGPAGAMSIRLFPQPTAANVNAGDKITLYYVGNNTTLVNPTDVPGIPRPFHMAIVYLTLADYWLRQKEADNADRYQNKANALIAAAKAYGFNRNQTDSYVMVDAETAESGSDGLVVY